MYKITTYLNLNLWTRYKAKYNLLIYNLVLWNPCMTKKVFKMTPRHKGQYIFIYLFINPSFTRLKTLNSFIYTYYLSWSLFSLSSTYIVSLVWYTILQFIVIDEKHFILIYYVLCWKIQLSNSLNIWTIY